jgi:DNA-binding CsgD family transcriptional regulator
MVDTTKVEQLLAEIGTQARVTNRLLAAQLKSSMQQNELVELLSTTGASLKDIALVLGTTTATVKSTRGRLRKSAPSRRNRGARQ